jgi:hypothetical protein
VKIDAIELRELECHLFAHPQGQARGVGVVEAGKVVEQMVVEPFVDRLEEFLDVPVVKGPSEDLVQWRGQVRAQQIAVSV